LGAAVEKKYDWDTWLRGKRTVLVRGKDYHTTQSSMCQQAVTAARARGIKVKVVDGGDRVTIWIRTTSVSTPE
jgi:hypothetical protein